jgi:hypothetical protein
VDAGRFRVLADPNPVFYEQPERPFSLLLTSAAKITPLYKGLSTDFKDSIDFYAIKNSADLAAVKTQLGVEKIPSLVLVGSKGEKTVYAGQ